MPAKNRLDEFFTKNNNKETHEFHEYANIFPLLPEEEFKRLVKDIEANGLLTPIKLYQGKIIDGRNRYLACAKADVQRHYEVVNPVNLAKYVISQNCSRRQLQKSQQAWIAASLCTVQNCTRSQAAKLMNISVRSVASAIAVQKNCAAEVLNAVRDGEISVSLAERMAQLTFEEQCLLAKIESKKDRIKTLCSFEKKKNDKDFDPEEEMICVPLYFSRRELKNIYLYKKRGGPMCGDNFMREIILSEVTSNISPKLIVYNGFLKPSYNDSETIVDKDGASQEERDEAAEEERYDECFWDIFYDDPKYNLKVRRKHPSQNNSGYFCKKHGFKQIKR